MTELLLTVRARHPVAEGVLALELADPTGAALPEWTPGAHLDLVLAPDLVRQYSLCGDPADRTRWRIAVLREPAGRGGSARLHNTVRTGDTVRVRGPRNRFPLEPSPRYLFVAGGIGITPLLPMLTAAEAAGADWRLAYGGRTAASMAFAAELHATHGDRVSLYPQDEHGPLDLDRLLGPPPDNGSPDNLPPDNGPPAGTLVYCCGPGGLLDEVHRRTAHWPAGVLHVERFTPEPPEPREMPAPDQASDQAFEVELALSGLTLRVPPDRSVLDVLEEHGVPVLSSCRAGTCGTCETTVLAGRVDHRDSLLTEPERAAHDTMFPCVSRAAGPTLLLEL